MTPERVERLRLLAQLGRRREQQARRHFATAVATAAQAALQVQRVEALVEGAGAGHDAVAPLAGAAGLRAMLAPAAEAARAERRRAEERRTRAEQLLGDTRRTADRRSEEADTASRLLDADRTLRAFLDAPARRRRPA